MMLLSLLFHKIFKHCVYNDNKINRLEFPSAFTKNFGVKAVMGTSVLLTWEIPETFKSEVPLKVVTSPCQFEKIKVSPFVVSRKSAS